MKSQDLNGVRTAQNIEQKYDLGAIKGIKTAVKQTQTGLTKIEQETEKIMEALIINLDGIVPEGAISLWFYSDKPTLENNPASNWEDDNTKNQHINDLYYDRETGYVYKFVFVQGEGYKWEQQLAGELVESMALTNASIDTEDNQRQVFFSEPTPPYSNGDWWIVDNGDLYVCQISKETGTYNKNDFIISNEYTYGTRANHTGNVLTVTSGRVTKIEEGINGLNSTVTETINDLTVAESQIQQNVDDITLLTTRTDTLGTKTSKLELDVAEIKSEIGEIADITVSADGIGSISVENINESEPIYMDIRPTVGDIKLLYPQDQSLAHEALKTGTTKAGLSKALTEQTINVFGVFPSETLYPNGGNIITFTNTTDNTTRDYTLPSDLLIYDANNYDEFILDYESEECYTIHRIGINAQGQKYVLSTPTTEYFTPYPTIALTAGDYTISASVPSAYIFARLMVANIYTTQFATKVEMNSKITQTATEINAEVSQKVGNDEVISKINLTPETATIQASKININGMITAINNNTSTTINGNKITTGTITASQLSSNSITSDKIQAGAITGAKISAGAITGDKISAGTIDSSKVNASIITTSNFSAQSISADQITGGTINGNVVNVANLNAENITAGTLSVARIPFLNASHISTGTLRGVSIEIGGSTYYLRMGNNWTKNPECSGLTIGSKGLRVNSGVDLLSTGTIRFLNASGQQVATGETRTCSLTYQTSITGSKTTATFYFRHGLLVDFSQG